MVRRRAEADWSRYFFFHSWKPRRRVGPSESGASPPIYTIPPGGLLLRLRVLRANPGAGVNGEVPRQDVIYLFFKMVQQNIIRLHVARRRVLGADSRKHLEPPGNENENITRSPARLIMAEAPTLTDCTYNRGLRIFCAGVVVQRQESAAELRLCASSLRKPGDVSRMTPDDNTNALILPQHPD